MTKKKSLPLLEWVCWDHEMLRGVIWTDSLDFRDIHNKKKKKSLTCDR